MYTYNFYRMRVFRATYDHVRGDIDKFIKGGHFQVVKQMLTEYCLKIMILISQLGSKDQWV